MKSALYTSDWSVLEIKNPRLGQETRRGGGSRELFHVGKQQPDHTNDDPSEHGIDADRDQVMEFDHDALEGRVVSESAEDPQEGRSDEIDEAREDIIRIGRHQFEQESQGDHAVQNPEAQLNQAGDAAECLLIECEQL